MKDKPLILIPVKTNSKRLPRKNLKMICGKMLFEWSLEAAIDSEIGKVYLSTSDEDLIKYLEKEYLLLLTCIAKDYIKPNFGVIRRPQELSEDPMQLVNVCSHARLILEKLNYLTIIMIQPSNPLVLAEDIVNAYQLFLDSGRRCVMSMGKMQKSSFKSLRMSDDKVLAPISSEFNRLRDIDERDYPDTYMTNGSIVVIDMGVLKREFTLFPDECMGYEMPCERSIDIDTILDFEIAEFLLKERHLSALSENGKRDCVEVGKEIAFLLRNMKDLGMSVKEVKQAIDVFKI